MADKTINKKTIGIILISCLLLVGIICGIYFIVKKITSENESETSTSSYAEIVKQIETAVNSAKSNEEKAKTYIDGIHELKKHTKNTGTDTCAKITEYSERVKSLTDDESLLSLNNGLSSSCTTATEHTGTIKTGVNTQ